MVDGVVVASAMSNRAATWFEQRSCRGKVGFTSRWEARAAARDIVRRSGGTVLPYHCHAAFDRFFFAIRPDYVIEVRPSVLRESDGPMLVAGLQQIHGQLIHLPRRTMDLPDPVRLERRYEQFRQAAG